MDAQRLFKSSLAAMSAPLFTARDSCGLDDLLPSAWLGHAQQPKRHSRAGGRLGDRTLPPPVAKNNQRSHCDKKFLSLNRWRRLSEVLLRNLNGEQRH